MEEPSEARFRAWVLTFLILIGPAIIFFAYYKLKFVGLNTKEAFDFAQIARNMISGKGFSTSVIRPLGVTGPLPGNMAETYHGPVFPAALAMAFAVLGPKDTTAALVSGLFYILTIPMVYLLGSRIFNRQIGLLAAGIVGINSIMLGYGISGQNFTLYIFLTTCLLVALHGLLRQSDGGVEGGSVEVPKGRLLVIGALTALLYLTEPVFVWVIPVILGSVVAFTGRSRWKNMAWALVPIVILVMPWMVRNYHYAGDPVYGLRGNELWMHTPTYYANDSGYRLIPSEVAGSTGLFKAIAKKIILSIGDVVETIARYPGVLLLFFFLPAMFVRFQSSAANAVRKIVLWCALFLTIGVVLIGFEPYGTLPLYVSLIPAITIYALCYLVHLFEQYKVERSVRLAINALTVFYVAFPLLQNIVAGYDPPKPAGVEAAAIMAKSGGPNDACLTDQPWTVAWYGNRRAVWWPGTPAGVRKIREQVQGLRWILLTAEARRDSTEWTVIYKGLYGWNAQYLQAKATGKEWPTVYVRAPKGIAEEHPLIPALDGFKTYPPGTVVKRDGLYEADPGTVLASIPGSAQAIGSTPAGS